MKLVVRLHRQLRRKGTPYRIYYVPDPIRWTEAPEDLRTLMKQRIRWQVGLSESLTMNLGLLFHRRGGAAGWLAFPFFMIFEWLGPVIEVVGYGFTVAAYMAGIISTKIMVSFLVVAVGFGVLLSIITMLIEEISFRIYPGFRHRFLLSGVAVLENLGYRQLNSLWRLMGLIYWLSGRKVEWGETTRKATWHQE
jgi:cellulose synthase/poly-beta-1,6-N-acetylglucosamine synthase-like glycosyltransferase